MIYLGLGQNSTNKHQVKMTRPPHGTTSASVNSYRVDFEESSAGRLEVSLPKDGNTESFDESSHLSPKQEKEAYTRADFAKRIICLSLCNLLYQIMLLYLIWKVWICSFRWGMAACPPTGNDWAQSQNVEVAWLRPAHSEAQKNNTKFDEVWNVLNYLYF